MLLSLIFAAVVVAQDPCCFIIGIDGNEGLSVGVSANWYYQTTATQTVATVVQTLYQYPDSTSLGDSTTQTADSDQIFSDYGLFVAQSANAPTLPGIPTVGHLLHIA